jgi:nitrate/nitrite transport system permease protein
MAGNLAVDTELDSKQGFLRGLGGQDLLRRGQAVVLPVLGVVLFLLFWQFSANRIETSLGQFPGPMQVWEQGKNLVAEHRQARDKADKFYQRQQLRNDKKLADNPEATIKWRKYTGKATFFDQIETSLVTVAAGFFLANIIAIPLGVICGLSTNVYRAMNPLIQVLKPVSPLAWLPLVTMVVSATYSGSDSLFDKSFVNSAITVALCCIWPTLINTTVGVAGIDKDLINVSRVMALSPPVYVRKIVLPSAIPMIFTGLRLSLATGWMVLIAAEMLAQNPGLGKFVWDEFQNGSSDSMGRIMVAVLTIGLIGFMLDKLMLALQKRVSWDKQATLR